MPPPSPPRKICGNNPDTDGLNLVYGDSQKRYGFKINRPVQECDEIIWDMKNFDKMIFFVFMNFIMAKAGFWSQGFAESWGDESFYTTSLDEQGWVEHFRFHEDIWMGGMGGELVRHYENVRGELAKIVVVFERTEMQRFYKDQVNGVDISRRIEIGSALLEEELSHKEHEALAFISHYYESNHRNFFIAYPFVLGFHREYDKQAFKKVIPNEDLLLTVEEFLEKVLPEREIREKAIEEWSILRVRLYALEDLTLLRWYKTTEKIQQFKDLLTDAENELARGDENSIYDAIMHAGQVCESVVKLYLEEDIKVKELQDSSYYDLLKCERDRIEKDFDYSTWFDLDKIRYWRNIVSHHNEMRNHSKKLDEMTATDIVKRAKLFIQLYEVKLAQAKHPK